MTTGVPTPEELQAAQKVGRYVGRTWHDVDTDDILGELNLWLVKNVRHLERWRGEGAHGANKLRVALAREARKYARKEHTTVHGGPVALDQSGYTEPEVEALVTYVLQYPDWSTRAQNGSLEAVAALADVSSVLFGMSKPDRAVLVARYGEDKTLSDVGLVFGCSEDAARMRVKRALERLRGRLGGAGVEWTGRRRVTSNASAQAATRGQES